MYFYVENARKNYFKSHYKITYTTYLTMHSVDLFFHDQVTTKITLEVGTGEVVEVGSFYFNAAQFFKIVTY